MPDEIDRLEIAVETQANKASRNLSSMEKRLNRIATSLERVVALSSGLGNIGNFDLSGFDKFTGDIDKAIKKRNELNKGKVNIRSDRSDLKYTEKSLDAIYDKYSKIGSDLDVSDMGLPELKKGLKESEAIAERLNKRLNKKISIEGTDKIGKSFESLIYDIQKATNEAEVYKKAIENMPEKKLSGTIERDGKITGSLDSEKNDMASIEDNAKDVANAVEQVSTGIENIDKDNNLSKTSSKFNSLRNKIKEIKNELTKGGFGNYTKNFMGMLKLPEENSKDNPDSTIGQHNNIPKIPELKTDGSYDSEAIEQYVNSFGKAESSAKTFEAQIKQLKAEMKTLSDRGLGPGDAEYDALAQKLAVVTEKRKEYNRSMKEKAKSIISKGEITKLQLAGTAIKAVTKGAAKLVSTTAKISFKGLSKLPKIALMSAKAFKTLGTGIKSAKDKLGLLQKSSNKGMSLGRMIGSSVLFSSIFGAISQIKEAIKEGSDNLVQYSSSYNQSISGMVTSLLYLKNAWAAAFAPIISVVAPYISKFVDMIANALNAVGQFFSALTGKGYAVQSKKTWMDYGKSIADTSKSTKDASKNTDKANKSAKELKKTVMSFDELHVLNSQDDSSSDSSSPSSGNSGKYTGPSPSEMFETVNVSDSANKWADMFKKAWKDADFTEIGKIVGTKLKKALDGIDWKPIQETAKKIGKSVGTFINGFVEVDGLGGSIGKTIGEGFNTGLDLVNSFLDTTKWDEVGKFIGDGANGILETVDWPGIGHSFAQKWNAVFETVGEAARTFDWTLFGKSLSDSVNQFISDFDWAGNGARLGDLVKGLLDGLLAFMQNTDWNQLGVSFGQFISNIDWRGIITKSLEALFTLPKILFDSVAGALEGTDWKKLITDVATGISDFLVNFDWSGWFKSAGEVIGAAVKALFDIASLIGEAVANALESAKEYFQGKIEECGGNIVDGIFKGITDAIIGIGTWINDNIFQPFIDGFKEAFGIHSPSTVMAEQGGYIMSGLLNGITEKLQSILDFFGDLKDKIVEKFSDIGDWFSEKFGKARDAVTDKFSDIGNWFSDRKEDIKGGLKGIGDWIGSKFSSGRKSTNESFKDVGTWFGNRKNEIQSNMKDIDSWMNTKYTNARKNVNSTFSDVGTWFGTRKSEIQNSTKDIDAWMQIKYNTARAYVNSAFQNVGSWFVSRRTDVQNAQNSISSWFSTKYQSARSSVNSAFNNVGSWFGNRRNDIQSNMSSIASWFRSTFQKAYNAITGIFNNIGSYFRRIGENIKSPIRNALNGVISGVNWVLGKLGSKTRFSAVRFATGTGANGVPQDTLGVVNDQAGGTYREMVQFPNGRTIIPKGRNVMLPMPKGTKVLPANKTAALMQAQNIPHFKKGIGDFFGGAWAKFKNFTGDVLDYAEHPKKLMQIAIDKFTDLRGAVEPGLSMAKGAVNTVFDSAVNKIKGLLKDSGGNVKYKPSAGVEQWRSLAKRALQMTNQYSEANLNRLLMQMKSESGGNPKAINNWDSNAKKGIPSKGLMQVIDPTFRAYALAPHNKNIYDPLSNMLAAIRYTVSRYGSLAKGWKGHGYELGGFPKNGEVYVANENGFGSEMIGKMGNRNVVANNQQITDGIKEAVIDAMMEVYIATQSNGVDSNGTIPYIINAVLKTEDNEVLARAVEKGQASRSSRFNPSPAY